MHIFRCRVGSLAFAFGVVLALSTALPASAQRIADEDVVVMICKQQGHTLVVKSMSPPDNEMEGQECSGALSTLFLEGMQLRSTTGSGGNGTVYTLQVPRFAFDELGLTYPLEARGCNCGDALPISGFDCTSCTEYENGCGCLFKKKIATP